MISPTHQALVELFRECPELGVHLARGTPRVDIPANADVRVVSAEFAELSPAEYRADVVLRLDNGRGDAADVLIIEAQLRRDADKPFTWHLYAAGARRRFRCRATVVVITLDEQVAAWCARPVNVDLMGNTFRPMAIGPAQIPVITEVERAQAFPELAVLSAMAHGHEEGAESIGLAALAACAPLDDGHASLYADIIYASMGEMARQALESLMEQRKYTYQTDFAKKHFGEGRRAILLEQLETRFGELPTEVVARVEQADPEEISTWARRILTADSVQAVFASES